MPRLPSASGAEARAVFERAGWRLVRQTGSHMIMTKPGAVTVLSIPNHNALARGTLRALIRQAGLDVEDFIRLR